jgi:hypothetical protein
MTRVSKLSSIHPLHKLHNPTCKTPSEYPKSVPPPFPTFPRSPNYRFSTVLVIGCGSYQPIDTYASNSSSAYPIYTDPSLRLHSLFRFKSNLAEGKSGDEQRDYMRGAGSTVARIWGGVKGALGNLQHVNSVGPKALNGGEVVIDAGKL